MQKEPESADGSFARRGEIGGSSTPIRPGSKPRIDRNSRLSRRQSAGTPRPPAQIAAGRGTRKFEETQSVVWTLAVAEVPVDRPRCHFLLRAQPRAAFVARSCLLPPNPAPLVPMRSQHGGVPGASDAAYPLTDLVGKHVADERRAHPRDCCASSPTPCGADLRLERFDSRVPCVFSARRDDLAARKRDVFPLHVDNLALATAGLKGSDDQRLAGVVSRTAAACPPRLVPGVVVSALLSFSE